MDERLDKIKHYFGLKHQDIVSILDNRHGFSLSVRQLIRIFQRNGLYRKKIFADILDAVEFISNEQITSGSLHGYRWMYQTFKNMEFRINKKDVTGFKG